MFVSPELEAEFKKLIDPIMEQARFEGAQIMYDAIVESQLADNVKLHRRYQPADVLTRHFDSKRS